MTGLPYMPLYVDRLVADTDHMSAEAFGAYVLLLCAMWRKGGWVPDINSELARICRVHPPHWKRVRAQIDPLLIHEGGKLSQKRLQQVLANAVLISSRAALKASSRWHPELKKINDVGHAAAMPAVMQPNTKINRGQRAAHQQAGRAALPTPKAGASRSGQAGGPKSVDIWDRVNERFKPPQPPANEEDDHE